VDHRKQRIITPRDRALRDVERRSGVVAERSRNLEVWVAFGVWLLLFAAGMSWRYGTPPIAAIFATIGAIGVFMVMRLLHRRY